jgi:hypothetical protein
VAVALAGGWLVAPSAAHEADSIQHNSSKHYKLLAKKIFYTKRQANLRFLNTNERARNSNRLDGLDSTAFALADQTMAAQWFKETADVLPISTTSERVVFTAPENATITSVTIEPAAAVTASDANHATITIVRRDADGSNQATVVAETTQTVGAGGTGSWTAFSTVSLGSLGNTSLTAGQKLTVAIAKTGLGVALPVLSVQIEYTIG